MVGNGRVKSIGGTVSGHGLLVQSCREVENSTLLAGSFFDGVQIGDSLCASLENRTLISRWQESAIKVVESTGGNQAAIENNKAGQVLI